jgi:hypothetical protein
MYIACIDTDRSVLADTNSWNASLELGCKAVLPTLGGLKAGDVDSLIHTGEVVHLYAMTLALKPTKFASLRGESICLSAHAGVLRPLHGMFHTVYGAEALLVTTLF